MPYRRSIFLINKKFQLRFSLYVCSWLFALSLVYPLIIHNLFELFVRYAALDPTGPALSQLERTRSNVFWLLVFLQLLFLGITFLISIFMSHRIAGPLYKLSKFFADAENGNLDQDLYFRKNDHFQDLADDYNRMIAGIRGTLGKNVTTASTAITRVERALGHVDEEGRKELEEALTALREIRERTPL
jgi:methyl-accepting chemotaxis protein